MEKKTEGTRASLELLYEISREVASALDLRTVLHRLLFLSMKNVGAISGSIIVLDENNQPVESAFLMHDQTHETTALQLRATYDRGMAGWVARNQRAVLVPDTSKDERWLRRPDDSSNQTGPKSAVSAPIMAQEKLVGVITLVHPRPKFFKSDHLELVSAIANQTGTAIRNAQLFESLQLAHQRYRELFEDSINPIVITNWKGQILEVNRQAVAVFGMCSNDIISMVINNLHDIDYEKLDANFDILNSGETVVYESSLHCLNNRNPPVEVHVRSIQTEEESHLQWIFQDISERKNLDSLREDLIAMVYHDLRSPLANVVSSLEFLLTVFSTEENPAAKSLVDIALRSTERVQRLTNSLLDIYHLESGQTIGNRQALLPVALLEDAISEVSPSAESKNQKIDLEFPSTLPRILADGDMIRRVFINLLENSIKFTPEKGKIRVGANFEDCYIKVWVEDSGPGIQPADQEHVFEKFSRFTEKEGPRGLGLGLAFCRLAIESHGGRIWVESAPGNGTKFVFLLPVVDDSENHTNQ